MSVADLKARTQQIFDTFNTHDAEATAALFAEDAVLHDSGVARHAIGPRQIAALFPDVRFAFTSPTASELLARGAEWRPGVPSVTRPRDNPRAGWPACPPAAGNTVPGPVNVR